MQVLNRPRSALLLNLPNSVKKLYSQPAQIYFSTAAVCPQHRTALVFVVIIMKPLAESNCGNSTHIIGFRLFVIFITPNMAQAINSRVQDVIENGVKNHGYNRGYRSEPKIYSRRCGNQRKKSCQKDSRGKYADEPMLIEPGIFWGVTGPMLYIDFFRLPRVIPDIKNLDSP